MRLVHALVVLLAALSLGRATAQSLPTSVFIQAGHSGEISRMAVSPDGRHLATSSYDGTVKLWEIASRREIYTVRDHVSIVNGVAFTPDGRYILSAGAQPDRTVLVVERETGRTVRRLAGHPEGASAVASLPDSKRALSVGEKGAVILWNLESGAILAQWTHDIPWITSVAIAPDGASAVLGAANGRILHIALPGGALIREYPRQSLMVAEVAFDPKGRYFVTAAGGLLGQKDPAIVLWSPATGEELRRLAGPPGTVLSVAVSPDGEVIAAGGGDTALGSFGAYPGSGSGVWIWGAMDGARRAHWPQAERWQLDRAVSALAFTPDGGSLAYARKDRTFEIRGTAGSAAAAQRFDGRASGERRLALTPDSQSAGVAVSILDSRLATERRRSGAAPSATQFHGVRRVMRWNLRTGVREQVQDLHNNPVAALVAGGAGELRSFSILSDRAPAEPGVRVPAECETSGSRACIEWWVTQRGSSTHLQLLREVTDFEDRTQRRQDWKWNPRTRESGDKPAFQDALYYSSADSEGMVVVSRSGERVALALPVSRPLDASVDISADEPVDVVVYEREGDGYRLVATLRSPRRVTALAFTRDEASILAGVCETSDKERGRCGKGVRLHRVVVASGVWTHAEGTVRDINQIALSPDGKFALTSGDYGAFGWNAQDLSLAAVLREPGTAVRASRAVAWSPDQQRLAVASYGRMVRIWETRKLALEREIGPLDGAVQAMAYTADGTRLVTVSDDGALRLWDAASGALLGTMTEFDDGEWITVIPEGYFVGSGAGDRQLNVRYGDRVYGMDQFFDVFYRPDIVERKLAGEKIDDLVTVTIEDALRRPPPRVELGAPAPGEGDVVRVRVSARTAGGGVGDVRVFHNGKLVSSSDPRAGSRPVPRLDAVAPAEQNSRGLKVLLQRRAATPPSAARDDVAQVVEIRLAPGENRVWATAFNADDTLQSRPVMLELPSRPEAPPRVFVLAIGVDRYVNAKDFATLRYAVKDARDVSGQLRERFARVVPGGAVDVRLLEDTGATLASVEGELERLRRDMRPGDIFVWFIASHGVLDDAAGYNVVLHDADLKQPGHGVLSTARMLDWLKRLPPLNQVLVLDTCHAGGLDSAVRGLYDARIAVLARSMGLHILASASATESAIDGYKGNGLFTHSLLRGMDDRAADANEDGRLTVTELGRYSRQLTANIAREIRFRQNPMVFHFGRDLVVTGHSPAR